MSKFCMETASPLVKAAYNLTIAALGESAREGVLKIIDIDKIIEDIENWPSGREAYGRDDYRWPVQTRAFWSWLAILKAKPLFLATVRNSKYGIDLASTVIVTDVLDYLPLMDKESVREDCLSVVAAYLRASEEMAA